MEVTLRAAQFEQTLLEAKFVMVTLSPEGKPAPNVPLKLKNEMEKRMFEQGERENSFRLPKTIQIQVVVLVARQNRSRRSQTSLLKVHPTSEEVKLIWENGLKNLHNRPSL